MKTSNSKIGVTIKAKIGSVEIMTFIFFTATLIISIRQFFTQDNKAEWIYIISFILILMTLVLVFVNHKSKTIILSDDCLIIKRPLILYSRTYSKTDLKGFDLQEYYDTMVGPTRRIRIWTVDGKMIALVRDAYTDYGKLPEKLSRFGLRNLGTVALKTDRKKQIGLVVKLTTGFILLMFLLLTLIKSFG